MAIQRPSFETARRQYTNRYTLEHIPAWVECSGNQNGYGYYAPQYRSDREWYDNTIFPGEPDHYIPLGYSLSTGQTYPLGHWLREPYSLA